MPICCTCSWVAPVHEPSFFPLILILVSHVGICSTGYYFIVMTQYRLKIKIYQSHMKNCFNWLSTTSQLIITKYIFLFFYFSENLNLFYFLMKCYFRNSIFIWSWERVKMFIWKTIFIPFLNRFDQFIKYFSTILKNLPNIKFISNY